MRPIVSFERTHLLLDALSQRREICGRRRVRIAQKCNGEKNHRMLIAQKGLREVLELFLEIV